MVQAELPIVDDEEEIEETQSKESAEERKKLLEALQSRCNVAKLECGFVAFEGGEADLRIEFPAGRAKRTVGVSSVESARNLLNIPFEKLNFIQEYEAICNYQDGYIEASIRPADSMPLSLAMRRIFGTVRPDTAQEYIKLHSPSAQSSGPTISIRTPSKEFRAISRRFGGTNLTLRLDNVTIGTNEKASEILTKFANSLFFQVDLMHDFAFILERERARFVTRVLSRGG
jgi:hypothetical protein